MGKFVAIESILLLSVLATSAAADEESECTGQGSSGTILKRS